MTEAESDLQPVRDAIIDHRLQIVLARFGERFDDAQKDKIRDHISRSLGIADALRTAPLTNADEPEIVFAPFVSEVVAR